MSPQPSSIRVARFLWRRRLPLAFLLSSPSPPSVAGFGFHSHPHDFPTRMTIPKSSRRSPSSLDGSTSPLTSNPAVGEPFRPPSNFRGMFAGSGSDGMSDPFIASAVLDLTDKERPEDVTVLYLGTATYDLPRFREKQTFRFRERGCEVIGLDVALDPAPSMAEMERTVAKADVIVVAGGNTLYAVDRWRTLGLDELLREAADRGVVLTGGSAGAICWFDGGHSDSADPDTWRGAMLEKFGSDGASSSSAVADESSSAPASKGEAKEWSYLRVAGLSVLPGLVCPHHDVTQSNGILRSTDFDSLLLRHPGEAGIAIDHWAALEVRGEKFRVLSVEGKPGSVSEGGRFSEGRDGSAGVWIKEVFENESTGDYTVRRRLCPKEGKVEEFIRFAGDILHDVGVEHCRVENPIPVKN
mmetsp:Transcript_63138/g.186586  ORF Transcript_63138/g.186586 Transcript_63138/m.186586 type:complete len:413 (-) Transcript_63138:7-1245(-)